MYFILFVDRNYVDLAPLLNLKPLFCLYCVNLIPIPWQKRISHFADRDFKKNLHTDPELSNMKADVERLAQVCHMSSSTSVSLVAVVVLENG